MMKAEEPLPAVPAEKNACLKEKSMSKTYVTGHRNPDTDSIVSAMAYAALKNALGERDVVPVRLGELNNETMTVLERFGFEPPMLINTVKTQLSDVQFDRPPIVGSGVTVRTAWDIMLEHNVQLVSVADEDCRLVGVLTVSDIAEHDMRSAHDGLNVDTTAFNLASALEGMLVGGVNDWETITGPIEIAVDSPEFITRDRYEGCVLIAGNQKGIIRAAKEAGVKCLVLCQVDAGIVVEEASEQDFCIILTYYDPYRASRMISHAIPVSRLMRTEGITSFHIDDFLDDVRQTMQKNRAPSYPVLDAEDKVLGTVSRYHLLNHSRKKVILVDHNERRQSVPGLDQAELLEIIDHHRIADLQTDSPVYFRGEPVGSTTTLVASLFFEHGVTPSRAMAGLISAGIISDTVMFKSPTCTEKDRRMAYRMVQLAGIDIEKLGAEMFSAASSISNKSPDTLLFQDFKEFVFGEHKVGIGQITCMNYEELEHMKEELLACMEEVRTARSYDMVLLMLTQIIDEGTMLLYVGKIAEDVLNRAFTGAGHSAAHHQLLLPGVMSRKKQVVPNISAVLD